MKELKERDRKSKTASTLNTRESERSVEVEYNQRKNEMIFKHLTFDCQGNPLSIHEPDLEKFIHNQIAPRYKVTKYKPPELEAVQALKGAMKRSSILMRSSTTAAAATPAVEPAVQVRKLNQRPLDPYEIKMHSLLEKLHPKSDLRALLSVDDKSGGRRMTLTQKSNVNQGMEINKGVTLNNQAGVPVKSGGKI